MLIYFCEKNIIRNMNKITIRFTYLVMLVMHSNFALSQWLFDLEVGVYSTHHNKVQIPNTNQGDRFEITNIGNGSFAAARVTMAWLASDKHEIQLVYVPFSYKEVGVLSQDIRYNGSIFSGGQAVETRYQFNSYRIRYLYHWIDKPRWQFDLGGTLFIRDASISLSQNGTYSEDDNLGFVPLFAIRSAYIKSPKWALIVDTDFAFAPQGRAIDLEILAQHRLDKKWTFAAGYRTIEGGADNDEVYNFAWFNGLVFKASYVW